MGSRWKRRTVVAGLGLVSLAGCVWLLLRHAARIPERDATYVALGSSFAAGPGIGVRAADSYLPCLRSSANYAHRFAERAGLSLTDVTCSGATTRHILVGGQLLQPAQIDAVRRTTKVVTLTVGGNDVGYLGNLGAHACANDPADVPSTARLLGLCRSMASDTVEQAFARLPDQMTEIVQQIRNRAPDALVIFVDYTDVLPDTGTCDALHLSLPEAEESRQAAMRLSTITAQVAWKTGSSLVQASRITHGHDVCSAEPWVDGFQFSKHLLASGPVPFHPRAEAMQAIASALADEIARTTHS